MSWVRLDDGAPGHRKIIGLSDAAFRLWIVCLTHCNQQANDGRFAAAAARIMCGYLERPETGPAAIAELVAAELWHKTGGGYEVHDYLTYQPSKEERDAANKSAAERMRRMRQRRNAPHVAPEVPAELRRNTERTSGEVQAKFATPDPSRPVPTRPGMEDITTPAPSDPPQPELQLQPQQAAEGVKGKTKPKRASAHTAIATALLGELSAARMRINPHNKPYPPSQAHLHELERCLREGLTVEQLRNVILVWEAMVRAGKQDPGHFDSTSPFRAKNVAKYTEMSLDDARKPRNAAPAPWQAPKPESGLDRLGRLASEELERRRRAESAIEVNDTQPYMLGEGDER